MRIKRALSLALLLVSQHSNRVLAVLARETDELVEYLPPRSFGAVPIANADGCDQFFACCHADLPLQVVLPPDHLAASKIREATASAQ